MNDVIHALAVFDDGNGAALYAGGDFSYAPDSGDGRLDRWGCDTTPPVLRCPAAMLVNDGFPDGPGQVVTLSVLVHDDVDPTPMVLYEPPSGSHFARGTTVVTCTATDTAGNQSVCQFTVTVQSKARARWRIAVGLAVSRCQGAARVQPRRVRQSGEASGGELPATMPPRETVLPRAAPISSRRGDRPEEQGHVEDRLPSAPGRLPMMICKLVYVSAATCPLGSTELRSILSASRRNNAALDVTGMLLYHDGNFMQVLEGPRDGVHGLIEKIARDPRHAGILRLLEWSEDQRSFPDWRMGFRNLDELSESELEGVSPFLRRSLRDDEYRTSPDRAHQLLLSFRKGLR